MKPFFAWVLSLVLILSLAGCNAQAPAATAAPTAEATAEPEPTAAPTPTAAPEETAAPEPSPEASAAPEASDAPSAEGGKTLVVYYSATGNTQEAANLIAELTGGDLFELEPADPYTDEDLNYSDENSRVVYEHDNPDARDVALVQDTVDNWEEYDTVFLGYPIWWGIAAWPVNDFVTANDFTGKTVIPFCTSSSSGLRESGTLLAELAGTGEWLEGTRFSSRVTAEDVQAWLDELGI